MSEVFHSDGVRGAGGVDGGAKDAMGFLLEKPPNMMGECSQREVPRLGHERDKFEVRREDEIDRRVQIPQALE